MKNFEIIQHQYVLCLTVDGFMKLNVDSATCYNDSTYSSIVEQKEKHLISDCVENKIFYFTF